MKYYTEEEFDEMHALDTLLNSNNKEWSDFAQDALNDIKDIGIEVSIDNEIIIDTRTIDDNSILADCVVAYDEYIASHIDDSEDFKITITIVNLLTGELIYDAYYERYNDGESTCAREECARKELREII